MSRTTNPFSMIKPKAEPRDRLSAFAIHRAEFADLARAKLRQARHDHVAYSPQTERVIELLSDWTAGFLGAP